MLLAVVALTVVGATALSDIRAIPPKNGPTWSIRPPQTEPEPALPTCPCFALDGTYGIDTIFCQPVQGFLCEDDIFNQLGLVVEVGVMRTCDSGSYNRWYVAGATGLAGPNCYAETTGGTTFFENLTQQQEDDCKALIQASAAYASGACP